MKADLVINIVQPGRFITIERGLTFHIRERRTDGQLLGIFIDDRRDPNERVTSLSEYGEIVETARGTFLLLMNGSVHRLETGKPDPTIVKFERYAFDLSRFTGGAHGAELRRARAQSVGRGVPRSGRPDLQADPDRNSAPNCTTGWSRRSIRSPSR